tara:strand:+ start:1162 stop:1269 length:108 start_codon:yes stop_codon:yes gene_type:complete
MEQEYKDELIRKVKENLNLNKKIEKETKELETTLK